MHHSWYRLHFIVLNWRAIFSEELLALVLVLFIFATPAAASTRLQDRSLFMQSSTPSATTSYTISFDYESPQAVGSVDMLFCTDPIPDDPCVTPPGLDVSSATLADQSGETGFSILTKSTNHIVLTRVPDVVTTNASSYTFNNIVNPSFNGQSFAIRLQTHGLPNATDPQIDFGSVDGEVTNAVTIQTQVPPMLIFCVAQTVEPNCTQTEDSSSFYTDMGDLSPDSTLTAQSQMAVGTNASGGFAITANGTPPSAGTNVINAIPTPTVSTKGVNQFGINLVANNEPTIGSNPEGDWDNAIPSSEYGTPNEYEFVPGSVVAYSPDVSLMEKFTVSYILNSSPDLHPGVYSTTITYIASGRF